MKNSLLITALLLIIPRVAHAQLQDLDVVDRLVATVGDSAIVQTQVQEEIQRMQLGGAPVPEPGTADYDVLFERILNRFIDRLLVLQAAARDSLLQVSDEAINERVTEQITQLTTQFGGQLQLQEALAAEALTLTEYREILSNEQRVRLKKHWETWCFLITFLKMLLFLEDYSIFQKNVQTLTQQKFTNLSGFFCLQKTGI